ncbi:MAG: NACHT domain-containing protein [Chloroflexi bacterium]|nr:NACHT domain-containing protein [Chloroflexota bacterium]
MTTPDRDDLKSILDRIASGQHTAADVAALVRAVSQGQLTVATGDRAVALGGDATDAIITTGDNNRVVRVFKGPDMATIQEALRRVLHPDPGPPEEIDLRRFEDAFCQRVKERFAAGAPFYIPLLGEAPVVPDVYEWVPRGQQIERVKLPSIRAAVDKYPCIILLGDPGCGKSTALQNLAYQVAAESGQLPLPVSLGEFSAGQDMAKFLEGYWRGTLGSHWQAPELADRLQDYLAAGRLLLLCDGLNEMPRKGYEERVTALRDFIENWVQKGNRFVVTCRVLDYGAELDGLQRVEVQPFSDDQIRDLLQKRLPDGWQALWQTLVAEHEGTRRLLEMARNPFNLRMMIEIFIADGQLYQNRAGLLERFTRELFARELQRRTKAKVPKEEWLGAEVQRASLAELAYEMGDRSGFGAPVETVLAQSIMPKQVRLNPNYPAVDAPPGQVLKLAVSAHILEMPVDLLEMPVDRSSVRFYHQLLQEYFAALELRRRTPGADAATQAKWWRWPWREAEMPPWVRPAGNYDPLPAPPPTGWEETTILAAGLVANDDQLVRALLQVNPVLAGRCLHEGQARVSPALRQAVMDGLLAAIGDGAVALRVRLVAGEVLGYLGDPRLGELVTVPAGEFKMGEGKAQHTVILREYRLGKYPVTNAEYARFVAAGGYQQQRWWTEAGWARKIDVKWTEPTYWQDLRYNKPNQPVVGVSWYEAVAYCRWLSAELKPAVRLPSEAQWEKGARGTDGRVYPWGSTFDAHRLNCDEGEQVVRNTTPVGIYPAGAGPYGAFDCAGNVWEWCATKYDTYPYDATEDEWQAAYLAGNDVRVLRGGAFLNSGWDVRCALRNYIVPRYRNVVVGFRVAASPSL